MTPLTDNMRSQGGKNRANNQTPEERKFQALIAASRRPLLNDANMTPEETLSKVRELAESRQWFYVGIVGADRSFIRHDLSDGLALRRLKEAGGAIGFLGVTMLGTSLQVYYKPLKRGLKVIEDLHRVSKEVTAEVMERLGQYRLPPIEG